MTASPTRRRTLVVTAGIALLVAAALGMRVLGDDSAEPSGTAEAPSTAATPDATATDTTASGTASSDPASPPPSPGATSGTASGSASGSPASTPDVDASTASEIDAAVDAVLESVATIDEDTPLTPTDIDGIGDALASELEAERLEFDAEGWTRQGRYEVLHSSILSAEPADDPVTIVLATCLDSSGLEVRRADGELVPGTPAPPATMHFTLERQHQQWVVLGRTHPDDPRCAQEDDDDR